MLQLEMVKRTAKSKKGRSKTRKSGSVPNLNITSPSQFKQLTSVLGKNPVVLVFVYADWCGHCQHFKPDWKKVANTPARNMAMVAIRDDVFKNSPLNNLVNPEGYPTVAVASAANNVSVNLPTREPSALTKVVKSANILAPAANGNINAAVNNVINNSANNNNSNMNMNNSNNSNNNSNMNMNKSNNSNNNLNENDDYALALQKATPTKVIKEVSRDTVEPPMSEEAYMDNSVEEGSELSPKRNQSSMNQLGGGLFEQLLRRGRVA